MRVREYRLKKGYSQEEMANFLGIEQTSYSKKENSHRAFSIKELFILEEVLEATINELFKDIEEEAKKNINYK